jgi:hypothetical protein
MHYRPRTARCPICGIRVKSLDELDRWDWKTFSQLGSYKNPYAANFDVLFGNIEQEVYNESGSDLPAGLQFEGGPLSDWERESLQKRRELIRTMPCIKPVLGDSFWVKCLDGKKIQFDYSMKTIGALRQCLAHLSLVAVEQVRLVYRGNPLWDEAPLTMVAVGGLVHTIMQMRGDIGSFTPHLSSDIPAETRDSVAHLHGVEFFQDVLSAEQCAKLSRFCPPADQVSMNSEATLCPCAALVRLLGVSTLAKIAGMLPFDVVKTRTVIRGAGGIPFHYDVSQKTLQIFLNSPHEYEGGRVVFQDGAGGQFSPERRLGCGTLHDCEMWHGVTPVTKGIRQSLFFIQTK